ncbi:MAG: tRNA pseudouridine(38-40) synthase TruA [Alphaproteobacteria bacterium]|nr:tRNA pseudouridine(38-40) synthase TruA [Alphaproteobacteria bacterium]
MRYKLILEYDGSGLVGWQAQADGISVQSLIQDAIYKFCKEHTEVIACGRTDAGVHALGMVAHFDINKDEDANTVMRAVNFHLADAKVAVLSCDKVSDDFHARFSCQRRDYKYIILNRRAPAVLDKDRVWWVPRPLDIDAMRRAADDLIGNHDWTSFRAAECQAKSPIKTLDNVSIEITDYDLIIIRFSAKSFLHHQVRNMVGTLVEIGLGKPYDIKEVLAAKDRSAAGSTAPAYGLYFVSAEY